MKSLEEVVAAKIRRVRQERNLHQQALADAVHIKRTSISNIENGRQALSLDLFCRIAFALDYEPWKLLKRALEETEPKLDISIDIKDTKIRELIEGVLN
jgi:transcriptional regulator with XRE-family HTH domain